jgi:hypothetical protein
MKCIRFRKIKKHVKTKKAQRKNAKDSSWFMVHGSWSWSLQRTKNKERKTMNLALRPFYL